MLRPALHSSEARHGPFLNSRLERDFTKERVERVCVTGDTASSGTQRPKNVSALGEPARCSDSTLCWQTERCIQTSHRLYSQSRNDSGKSTSVLAGEKLCWVATTFKDRRGCQRIDIARLLASVFPILSVDSIRRSLPCHGGGFRLKSNSGSMWIGNS
jgi:hypothetical protein